MFCYLKQDGKNMHYSQVLICHLVVYSKGNLKAVYGQNVTNFYNVHQLNNKMCLKSITSMKT